MRRRPIQETVAALVVTAVAALALWQVAGRWPLTASMPGDVDTHQEAAPGARTGDTQSISGTIGPEVPPVLSGGPTASPALDGGCAKRGPQPLRPVRVGSLTVTAVVERVAGPDLLLTSGGLPGVGPSATIRQVRLTGETRVLRPDLCPQAVQDLRPGTRIEINGDPLDASSMAALEILVLE